MIILRFLLIFLLIYLVLRFLGRVLFVFARSKYAQGNASTGNYREAKKKEGDVTINYQDNNRDKKFSKDDGEYVNYEEVKD